MNPTDFLPLHPKDFLILLVLAEGDSHGYGILKAAEEHSRGKVSLDPANLYRRLQRLTRDGLVADGGEGKPADSDGAPRRYHTLTPSGRRVLEAEAERLAHLTDAARGLRLISGSTEAGR